ncbi:DUF4835 family protein [Proteiniphilum acetatigenes]|uniref:type IX secretion system protein PorD n=1 Tax=Proteiniphilum acetatigenes TaxID=294710 RepID=UPI0003680814|nr:DUF4835 family protein [Proteiniphilum acetatigenes]SFL18079.1 protein of unknown function [Porphyromonadaceae bacterium KH3CP3RA]
MSRREMYCWLVILFFTVAGISPLSAQELSAFVKVNSSRVQGANRQVFDTLEEALRTFINGRRWTDSQLLGDKRINCSFTLVITEALSSGSFKGELYVQSYRPVENSDYSTPMLNVRDTEMEFDYTEHQSLQFDLNFIQGNLTAIIAYYTYLILGLDLDSRSSLGGTSCFRNMELIAVNAQSYGWKGWDRRSNRNRSAIAVAFNDGALEGYRHMWFDYHRQGLDVPAGNGEPGSEKIVSSVLFLSALQTKRPTSVLIKLFGDTKLEEMVNLLSKTDARERRQAHEALLKLYPARNTELGRLR